MRNGATALAMLITVSCASRPALTPCTIEEVGVVQCTTVRVPENWNARGGRTIDLHVVVLPATGTPRANDPVYILQGGPGQAATSLASFYAETYAASRAHRDIVLADQRGTGKSNGLGCESRGALDLFEINEMRACRDALVQRADLSRYTTADAVRDLEAVRKALGYERLNLYGTSYGTRLAMDYAAAHPSRVRTLTLKGVLAHDVLAPAGFAEDTERALRLTIEDCAADAACNARYPTLAGDYAAIRSTLGRVTVDVNVDGTTVTLTQGLVGAVFRSLLQSTGSAADIPRLLQAANRGDWTPIATAVRNVRTQAATAVSTGMMLSVICSEDVPFIGNQRIEYDTFLHTYWLDQTRAACAEWPSKPARRPAPKTLDIPALLISGYLDSATPPAAADRTAKFLPRSHHLVARNGSHSFTGMRGCVDVVMNRFVEHADPAALDSSCAASVKRPAWK